MRNSSIGLIASATLLALVRVTTADAVVDHFTCYATVGSGASPAFSPISGVSVVDRFGSSTVTVRRPKYLCAPTSKNGEDPTAPSHPDHLADYTIRRSGRSARVTGQAIVDQFGVHTFDLTRTLTLQVPAAKSLTAPPAAPSVPAVDHFQCWKARVARGTPRFTPIRGVTVQDQFGTLTVDVRKPRRVCAPANKRGESPGAESHLEHLVCYQIKDRTQPAFAARRGLFVADQFGNRAIDVNRPRELCVPALRAGVATPTPTATPMATTDGATPTTGPTGTSGSTATGSANPTATPTTEPSPAPAVILAGAAKANITPFTLTPALLACRDEPSCPYHAILALSNPAISNPDGLPGGLFDQIGQEMAPGTASSQWIGPTGVWGESYMDGNQNGRYDNGEGFTDDAANQSPVVGAGHPSTLGDPVSSTNKWDGIFIAGYGSDRQALGGFDPLSVRVLFLRDTRSGTSIAWVTIDTVGYFSDFVPRIRARLAPDLDVDEIILTHTHDHEGADTVGLWGADTLDDGTYPRFDIYIEAKIAQAITEAAGALQPARFRAGEIHPDEAFVTPRGNSENMEGMISRNSCRTPWFFDDERRAMPVVADGGPNAGGTIATLINWGAHVESMDARNVYLSADFPNAARGLVEEQLGGVALYAPAAQGDAEIVGDSCTRRWSRDTFDGETFPVREDGEPVAFGEPYDNAVVRERAYAIGRVVGSAALAALASEPLDPPDAPFELVGPHQLCFPVNNEGLLALAAAGVIDKPLVNADCPAQSGAPPERGKTNLWALRIGSASFLTAPGEVFPELYYGVSVMNRGVPTSEYVSPNPAALECAVRSHHGATQPGGHSDRPYEPTIRGAQVTRFGARVNFLIGYTPDLLGYIVPGYDYFWRGGPGGFGIGIEEIEDPCRDSPPDLAFPNARYGSHYHETNSAGSMLAPAVACELVRLLGDPLGEAAGNAACTEWDLTNLTGRPPDEHLPIGYEPGCPMDPNACLIRHY